MDVFAELIRMAGAAARLWLRRLPVIGMWVCLGWAGRELATAGSVALGAGLVPALLLLVLGMLIWVVCLVMMLHSLSDDLTCVDRLDAVDPEFPALRRGRREVLLEAVIPFLAVYAVWGLTEEQVRRAFSANLIYHGAEASDFSITFAAWRLYLGIAIGAWLLQATVAWWLRRRYGPVRKQGVWAAIVLTLLRGISLITAFVGLDTARVRLQEWFYGRRVWQWLTQGWQAFLDALPGWRLPWDLSLPEAVARLAGILWDYVVPGLFSAVLLPVVWLALTAMVFGWDEFARSGVRLRLPRFLSLRLDVVRPASPAGALRSGVRSLAEDVLPAVQALRLLLRSGLGFLAAYLLLGVLARALEHWITSGLLWLIGPRSFADTLVHLSAVQFVAEFFAWTVAGCVYIAAFDRAMNLAMDRGVTTAHPGPSRPPGSGSPRGRRRPAAPAPPIPR